MRSLAALCVLSACLSGQGLPDQAAWFTRPGAAPVSADADLAERMAQVIGAARTSVAFAMMRLDEPRVIAALVAAKDRGVAVRVLTDDDIRALRCRAAYDRLVRSGVAVRTDRGFPWGANMHHKFCVVDETHVWSGDWNAAAADSESDHGAFLVKCAPLAVRFTEHFGRMWRGEAAGLGSLSRFAGRPADVAGGGTARAHFGSAEDLGVVVADEILKARVSVEVAHTFFSHRRVMMALLEVARKGVRVRIGASFFEGRARVLDACARFGIPVSKGAGTKTVVIDGRRVLTGSWNATSGVDHENLVVLDRCPVIVKAYGAHVETVLAAGEKPFFLAPSDPVRSSWDRDRDARLEMLAQRNASTLPPPADSEALDRSTAFSATFMRGAPVVPTHVRQRAGDAVERRRILAIRFERSSEAVAATRFVISTSRLNDSNGPHMDPRHRPLVFSADIQARMDTPLELPFDMVLPESGAWRVELDAFVAAPGGWRWVGNWRVPPSAWLCVPEVVVDGPRPAVVRELPVTSAPRVEAAGLGISCLVVAAMELEATAEGGEGLRLEWSADGRTWNSDRNGLDLPLVADGRRHTYFLDLAASAAWKSAGTVDALRLRRRGGRGSVRIHGWRLTRGADLGPASRGTFRTAEGAPRAVLSVEGGAADGRLWVRPRRPVRITVSSPAPSGQPEPFLLMVKRGLPGPSEAFDLSAFDVPGKLCFRPHLVTPPGVGVAGVADSTGLDSRAFTRPGPAPATFEVPLGVVQSGNTLVLQAVFTGRHKGVSNAVVIRVR